MGKIIQKPKNPSKYSDSLSLKEAAVEIRQRRGMGVTSRTADSAMKANKIPKDIQDKKLYSRAEFEKEFKASTKGKNKADSAATEKRRMQSLTKYTKNK
jgi:hypothetical protein